MDALSGLTLETMWLTPVAVVQPMLGLGLVVALGIRAVRNRHAPLRLELLGAALTTDAMS